MMKDIFDDPRNWLAAAAGTGARLGGMIALHAGLIVAGYLLHSPVPFIVAGVVLPALYLYAAHRLLLGQR